MTTTSACIRCGAPVFAEDRFCGACGAPQTPPPTPSGVEVATPEASGYSARLFAALRAATVGEYEIRGELGRGGMAAVYLAYDLRLNRKVAIKVMLPELAFHDGMEERFKREARTAAKLDHPNIVVIYSVRDDAELLYFVMKFIEGASLDQLIRRHAPLPIEVVQHLLLQLTSALQYAHEEGVVHRDVKPANVLVDRRGTALVTDFGIAKATESPHLTRTGSVIGTPAYMSPEQCLANEQTHASDQYSLGILAYELLAGRPPFTGSTVEIQWAHIKEEPPPLRTFRPECPPALERAVMRMLAKSPSDRWGSLRDLERVVAASMPPGDRPRAMLADLVRFTIPTHTHEFAITPASPIPRRPVAPRQHVWTTLDITPAQATLEVGSSIELAATFGPPPADASASAPTLTWSSSAEHIVSVAARGVATAHAPGTATITALAGPLTASAVIAAHPVRVATIEVLPERIALEVGTTQALHAVPRDGRGSVLTERTVMWTSSDAQVASVDSLGVVTATAVGRTSITATLDGRSAATQVSVRLADVATVSVTPDAPSVTVGDEITFSAELGDVRGHVLAGRPVVWRSSDPGTLRIDDAGRAVAVRAGMVTVTAACGDASGTTRVTVAAPMVAKLEIDVPANVLRSGKRMRLRGVLVGGGALALGVAAVLLIPRGRTSRESGSPGTTSRDTASRAAATALAESPAPVRPDTPVAGRTPGTPLDTPTTAALQPKSEAGSVRVSAGEISPRPTPAPDSSAAVASLRIDAASPLSIERGEQRSVALRATTRAGRAVTPSRVRWSVTDSSVISVARDGVITGLAAGRSIARATVDAQSAEIEVVVRLPAAQRVTIAPRPSTLRVGESAPLGAQAFDRRDAALSAPVTWRSSNANVASVDQSGTVRALRTGDVTIIASADAVADSVRLTVQPLPTVAANPQPARTDPDPPPPPTESPVTDPKGAAASTPNAAARNSAAAEAAVREEALATARATGDAIRRGQLGPVTAVGGFAKFVKNNRPELASTPRVNVRALGDTTAEAVVTLPLRWSTAAGSSRSGDVNVLVKLVLRDGTWRRVSASNLDSP